MKINLVYDNSGPRTPNGLTPNQTLASLSNQGAYQVSVARKQDSAPAGNQLAKSVVKSNGELIAGAQPVDNPLPPGVTV